MRKRNKYYNKLANFALALRKWFDILKQNTIIKLALQYKKMQSVGTVMPKHYVKHHEKKEHR